MQVSDTMQDGLKNGDNVNVASGRYLTATDTASTNVSNNARALQMSAGVAAKIAAQQQASNQTITHPSSS